MPSKYEEYKNVEKSANTIINFCKIILSYLEVSNQMIGTILEKNTELKKSLNDMIGELTAAKLEKQLQIIFGEMGKCDDD